jgi:hypothetical protein
MKKRTKRKSFNYEIPMKYLRRGHPAGYVIAYKSATPGLIVQLRESGIVGENRTPYVLWAITHAPSGCIVRNNLDDLDDALRICGGLGGLPILWEISDPAELFRAIADFDETAIKLLWALTAQSQVGGIAAYRAMARDAAKHFEEDAEEFRERGIPYHANRARRIQQAKSDGGRRPG